MFAGLKTLAVAQTLNLAPGLLVAAAAGRFHYGAWGLQTELAASLPFTPGVVLVKGALYGRHPGGIPGRDKTGSVSYRHHWNASQWTEAGWHQYVDGGAGPSLEWVRWGGDVGTTLYVRHSPDDLIAGIHVQLPLTPRQGMRPRIVSVAGPGSFGHGLRTVVAAVGNPNPVQPLTALPLDPETGIGNELLNYGRIHATYLHANRLRMRNAFHRYANR